MNNDDLHNLPEELRILQTPKYALADDETRAGIMKDLTEKFKDKPAILAVIEGHSDAASVRMSELRQQLKAERDK